MLEFVAFKEKLERSHQLMVARIESAILSLKRKANNLEELEVICLTRYFLFVPLVVSFTNEDARMN